MKKYVLIGLAVFGLFVLLPAVGFGAFLWRFTPQIPEATYPQTDDPIEARRQDLDYLRQYPDVDRSYSADELAAFNALLDDLEARVETMSEAEFVMGVSAAGAITENGHSGVSMTGTMNRLNSLPIRFMWFGDGLHIMRARAEHADLIGAKVAAYEGQTPEELYPKMDPYFGGNDAFLRQNSANFFAAPASLHAAGLIDEPGSVTLDLVGVDGEGFTRTLQVEEKATKFSYQTDFALGQATEKETESGHEWRFLDPAVTEATWYGRNPNTVLSHDALDYGGVYWRLRNIVGSDEAPVGEWLDERADALRESPADYLVVDLRANAGGDYTQSMSVAKDLGNLVKPDGRVYLLTDGDTFSAGIVTAYFALYGAGENAVLVGAPMGDDTKFWAEGGSPMTLPNSEIRLYASTGYHDWENGCSDWSTCFWINILFGVAIGPVEVDMPAPLLFSDYRQGIDSGMEAILAREAERAGVERPAS